MPSRTSLTLLAALLTPAAEATQALRFYGNGAAAPGLDRVSIRLDAPARPIDVGQGDFTVEFWLKAIGAENGNYSCDNSNVSWIGGNIILDRDINGAADRGDWGVSLANRRIAFGVSQGSGGATACGSTDVGDSQWHHIALTRVSATGRLRVFVDGQLEGSATGPTGDVSYRDGLQTDSPTDPFLVIGAEKLDVGGPYPSFAGWLDELRVSTVDRYPNAFVRPTTPFVADAQTAALYHFDEGTGDVINDVSGAAGGPSQGVRHFGGSPAGPQWTDDTPFSDVIFADGFDAAGLTARAGSVRRGQVVGAVTAGQQMPEAMIELVPDQAARRFFGLVRRSRPERRHTPQPQQPLQLGGRGRVADHVPAL
jgi:hypothetical protein